MQTEVNTTKLLAFLFEQMEKLDKGEIDATTAAAQAQLAKQANNVLDYELRRTIVQIKLAELPIANKPQLREIESGIATQKGEQQ